MSDDVGEIAFDRLIDTLAPTEFLPDDQNVEICIQAGAARAWLRLARTAKAIHDSKALVNRAQSNLRLAQAANRRADEVLTDDARLWFWCLLLTYPTTEFIMGVLS